jgi:hypothetical protein
MSRRKHAFWFPLLGLGFALAGADKLLGSGYRGLFRQWGWTEDEMRAVGGAELAGGVLIASEAARRLGGLVLTAISTAMLTAELRRGESERAAPRFALLVAAALAACPSSAR